MPNESGLFRKIIDTPTYVAMIYELGVAIVVACYRPRSLAQGTNAVKVQVALYTPLANSHCTPRRMTQNNTVIVRP